MRIHALQTGTVTVRARQRFARGPGGDRVLVNEAERGWSEPAPVLAFAIEHPDGLILVDTGQSAGRAFSDEFATGSPLESSEIRPASPGAGRPAIEQQGTPLRLRSNVRFDVERAEEVDARLHNLGLPPDSVRWIVLTHLHHDHVGGLKHFPRSEVILSRIEADARPTPLPGEIPQRWPDWLTPTLIEFTDEAAGPFERSWPLTPRGDVLLVPTPGHTAGHTAVLLREGDRACLFIGDAAFSQAHLLRGLLVSSSFDGALARRTMECIRQYSLSTPTVLLPAHDPEAARRLAQRETVPRQTA